jgi:hypothetical protein
MVSLPEIGFRSSCGPLPANLPLFLRLLQLPTSLGMDLLLTPGQHVSRTDITDGAIQADIVVMFDIALRKTPRIVQPQWRSWPDALST